VTGYEIYVNNALNTTVTGTSYLLSGLTASTTFNIYVKAKDAAGNGTNSNTVVVTTLGTSTETLIAGYYFETGFDNWADGGSNCIRYTGTTFSWEGAASINIRANSGTPSSTTSPTLNLTGYSQVIVKFYFYADGMENGEYFRLRYSNNNGSTWSNTATWTAGTNFSNAGFYVVTVTMNSTTFNSQTKFRFQCYGSDITDNIYVDAVTVTGKTNTSGSGNSSVITAVSKPPATSYLTLNDAQADEPIEGRETVLYPNPATNMLYIRSIQHIRQVRILNGTGMVMMQYNKAEGLPGFDISRLRHGIYIAEITTEKGIIRKKFLKR
jgi:hypothetical protein